MTVLISIKSPKPDSVPNTKILSTSCSALSNNKKCHHFHKTYQEYITIYLGDKESESPLHSTSNIE